MKNASDLRKLANLFPSRECARLRKRRKRILRKIVGYCAECAKNGMFEATYWSHEYPEPNLSVEEAESIAITLHSMGYLTSVTHNPHSGSDGIKISWK